MLVFWRIFVYCGNHYEKIFVFSREIFRISLVVELGLYPFIPESAERRSGRKPGARVLIPHG